MLLFAFYKNEENLWLRDEDYKVANLKFENNEYIVMQLFLEYVRKQYSMGYLSYQDAAPLAALVESVYINFLKKSIASIYILAGEKIIGSNVALIFEGAGLSKYQVATCSSLGSFYNWQKTGILNLNDLDTGTVPTNWLVKVTQMPFLSVDEIGLKHCSWLGNITLNQVPHIGLRFINNEAHEIFFNLVRDGIDLNIADCVNTSNLLSM